MQFVHFNTEEKAKRCFEMLGKRGAFYFHLMYADKEYGYDVFYFTMNGVNKNE